MTRASADPGSAPADRPHSTEPPPENTPEPIPAPIPTPSAAALRQLLRLALPDKMPQRVQGWSGPWDFQLTRSHVDADGDAFHDGLLITEHKRHDFWLALAGSEPAGTGQEPQALYQKAFQAAFQAAHQTVHQAAHWASAQAARAWTGLRPGPAPTARNTDGLICQARSYDAQGQPLAWQPLALAAQTGHLPPASANAHDNDPTSAPDNALLSALAPAWARVWQYWQAAEAERRAGWPLRAQLHAALTGPRIRALIDLPALQGSDWRDPERAGLWRDELWIGARQAGPRHGPALKLSWRNGQERPGDAEDDAHASYQIDLLEPPATPPPGTAHPPGLALSYSQRQSQPRQPLPAHGIEHLHRLLQLLQQAETTLQAEQARLEHTLGARLEDWPAQATWPALAHPPLPPQDSDAALFGPALLALSRQWQAGARSWANALRQHWAAPGLATQASMPASALPDPRYALAIPVLQLARQVHQRGDALLHARFQRRFTFAPSAYAPHAKRHGLAVQALRWQPDGSLLAWVQGQKNRASTCWQISADATQITPAPQAGPCPAALTRAVLHGSTLAGDADGTLYGMDGVDGSDGSDGSDGAAPLTDPPGSAPPAPLWQHHLGGAVLCLASAGPEAIAVGTASGYLIWLQHAHATPAHQPGTARLHELRRWIFWDDLPEPLAW